jgi:DNA-binding LytR/AlgR family response regulator
MKISCIITDDEPMARKGLVNYVQHFPFLEVAGTCEDALQLTALLKQTPADLLFLDIEMPHLSGIEWIKTVRNPPKVILTTAYENYALQGFELDVLDYLLKPISFERFTTAVNKAVDYFSAVNVEKPDYLFIKAEGRLEKIVFRDVIFIEALENYVCIQTETKKWITHSTLKALIEKLPPYFVQTHKSWVVNSKQVNTVQGNLLLCGRYQVPLSKYMKEEVLQKIVNEQLLK